MLKVDYRVAVLVFVGVVVVFFPGLFTFFSQDDFTHFAISKVNSVSDFFSFFVPVNTGIFYRPLSIQIFTWISRMIFGLNPFGYHAVALVFHLANVFLVYKILKKLTKYKLLSLLATSIYGFHPSHFMSIFWIAEFSMVLAPFFAFLAINDYLNNRLIRFNIWIVFGLLSNELVSVVPLVLGTYLLLKQMWLKLVKLIPAVIAVLVVYWLRFIVVPASLGSEYVLSFSLLTLWKNFRWHIIRAVGLPEGFLAYLNMLEIKINIIALLLFVGVLIWIGIFGQKSRLRRLNVKLFGFGLVWFFLGILPVSFLDHHQSPIYQVIGLPGILLSLIVVMNRIKIKPLTLVVMAGLFFISSFWGVRAQEKYHWASKRAKIAHYHIKKLADHDLKEGHTVVFLNTVPESSRQVYIAMAGESAVKVFYGEKINVLFEDFCEEIFVNDASFLLSRQMFKL